MFQSSIFTLTPEGGMLVEVGPETWLHLSDSQCAAKASEL